MELFVRSPDVLWRLGPDCVLVRRIDVPDGHPQDLGGAAALVWISLDEPGTAATIIEQIADAGLAVDASVVDEAIRLLVDEQLVVVMPADR